jgi:hypothetical protein
MSGSIHPPPYNPTLLCLTECTQTLHKVALLHFSLQRTAYTLPYVFLMAENYKAKVWVGDCLLAGIVGSNPFGGVDICAL